MRRTSPILLLACLSAGALSGQNVLQTNPGTVEVGVFGGIAGGLGRTAAGVGGNVGVVATKVIQPYFEVTFFPDLLTSTPGATRGGQTVTPKFSFTDYHGGVRLRVPFERRSDVMPYVSFGVGGLHKNAGQKIDRDGDVFNDPARTDPAVNFGAGLSYYHNKVGLKVEVKGYKPISDLKEYSDPFFKLTFGICYMWGRK